ncbi:MAG: carbohydrate binding family 9 domain-containing protein, partial [Armatimonadetes bacterium]|nr:carbohydrate binding family 9 domain-containing protein [Armatimonadota bacterium]
MDLRFWTKAIVWLILLLLFPTRGALAGQSPTVAPTPFKTPPLIDGKLYDPIWRQGAVVVLTKLGGAQLASQQTFVKVGYDASALYVSFSCLEDQPQKIAASVKQRDRDVFQDDCVELFLAPHSDSTRYYHFLVNAAGTQRDEVGMDSEWNANWQSGVTRDEKGWSVEMALPYDQLSLLPDLPAEWGVNFCREEQPHGELSSWSPCREGFHEPARFGKLVGMTADMKPAIRSTLFRRNDALTRRLDSVRGQPSEVKARKRLPYLTQLLQSGDLLALYQTLLQAETEAQAA